MSVLIVGGGIGGLCLAAALTRRGIACEIVEREPAWTTVGAGISFYPNGVRALRRLGLGEAAVSAGATIDLVRTCDRAGTVVSEFPGEYWEGIGQTFAIHRAGLQRILLDAVGDVPVHMGVTVASLDDRGDTVEVVLTDGTSLTTALVVGADGIRSRVRDLCIGRLQPRYVGQMYWRGAVDHDLVDTATMLFDTDRFVALLPLGSGTTYVALQHHSREPFDDASLDRFADFGGPTPRAITLLRADPTLHFGEPGPHRRRHRRVRCSPPTESAVGPRTDPPSDRASQRWRAARTSRARNARDLRAAGRRGVKNHHYKEVGCGRARTVTRRTRDPAGAARVRARDGLRA